MPGWFDTNAPNGGTPNGSTGSTTPPPVAAPNPTPAASTPAAPTPAAPSTNGGPYTGVWVGGGWNAQQAPPGSPQAALAAEFAQGVFGQAAVDAVNQQLGLQPGASISFSNGSYGLPGGYYVSPNPSNPNSYDLIARGGGSGGNTTGNSYDATFSLPSAADVANTPGYQFALSQGIQGVQRSAAAQGDLLTGGTLKAIDQYSQGLADQTYQNAVANAQGAFTTNFGVFNTGNQFLAGLANAGASGANAATS